MLLNTLDAPQQTWDPSRVGGIAFALLLLVLALLGRGLAFVVALSLGLFFVLHKHVAAV